MRLSANAGVTHELVLRAAYYRKHLFCREKLFVESQLLYAGGYELSGVVGVVDREASVVAYAVYKAAQNAHAYRVKSTCPYFECGLTENRRKTLFHLVCRLVGEGYRKNLPRSCRIYLEHFEVAVESFL